MNGLRINKFLCWCIVFQLLGSCQSEKGVIMTVNGPKPISAMGVTLAHEHVMVDFVGADSTGPHRWDRQEVVERALPFLTELESVGCQTLIECTPAYLGRDPALLLLLTQNTGLHIVTNTGFYGARNNLYIPARVYGMTARELADEWIAEFNDGIGETGIRPGFIKISVDANDELSATHKKLIEAAALTHQETGLVIMSHTGPDEPAFDQLAVLEKMNVPASAFIWTHAQNGTLEGWKKAAEMGAWVSLDNVNINNIEQYVRNLRAMKSAGLLDRVLISHDSGWYSVGEENGGDYNGYTVIFRGLIPALRKSGFTDKDIRQLLEKNPAHAFRLHL